MTQAQIDFYKAKKRNSKTFHLIFDEEYSATVSQKNNQSYLGIYKTAASGRRRGICLPKNVWLKIQGAQDMIDLGLTLMDGTLFMVDNG